MLKLGTVRTVELRSGSWSAGAVAWADTFWDRFIGLSHALSRDGVVLPVRSVHTLGMKAVDLVALDRDLVVVDTRRLGRNRVAWFAGAHYVLELPAGRPLPPPGAKIEVVG